MSPLPTGVTEDILANLPNRCSALCWRRVTHAQTWASYSALYRFGRLSDILICLFHRPLITGKKSIENYTDECIYGECANEQHVTRTLTLTLTRVTAYSVSGNVVRVRTLICVILYGFFPVIRLTACVFLAAYTLWAKPGCRCCPAWQTVICCIISCVRLSGLF